MSSKKPYNVPNRSKNNKKKQSKKSLEATTRIRVDDIRLNDSESLDTSFLEGRIEKQAQKDKKKVSERILNDNKKKLVAITVLKNIFVCILLFTLLAFLIFFITDNIKDFKFSNFFNNQKVEEKKTISNEKVIIDDNYLFVGDYVFDKMNFSDLDLDYHYLKSTDKKMTSKMLKNDLKNRIYVFNPSNVIIQIGTEDINDDIDIDSFIENYMSIIDGIKDNRPYSKICLVSLIPINKDNDKYDDDIFSESVNNDNISKFNSKIKSLSSETDVYYIDAFSLLSDDNKLSDDYSDDGIYLNKKGNELLINKINDYLEEN